jgi:hypothetical protein
MTNKFNKYNSNFSELLPVINRFGDCALNLAHELRKEFNIQTHLIIGNFQWNEASTIDVFPVTQVTNSSSKHLLKL